MTTDQMKGTTKYTKCLLKTMAASTIRNATKMNIAGKAASGESRYYCLDYHSLRIAVYYLLVAPVSQPKSPGCLGPDFGVISGGETGAPKDAPVL